jgi:hypothetical protein
MDEVREQVWNVSMNRVGGALHRRDTGATHPASPVAEELEPLVCVGQGDKPYKRPPRIRGTVRPGPAGRRGMEAAMAS